MKYSHIIYNSSQTNRDGRPGFGVRTMTAGTDPDLLTALVNADVFAFEYSHPKLTPNTLAADPSLIRLISPSYFYTFVEMGNSKKWVFGRKIAVGFDYVFYSTGKPTRLGNYVADVYVFDAVPEASVFEALYEIPAEGSMHFIPRSPEPSIDNDEMKYISLDRQQDLAPESLGFKAASLPKIDPRAIKLLFGFLAHLTNGKPVAAVIDDKDADAVIASFMRIIPHELIPRATFITNYNDTGVPPNFALLFVDPENKSQFVPAIWNMVDLTDPAEYESTEAHQLMPELDKALTDNDMPHLLNLARWLFSKEYASVKDLDASGRETAFRYVIESNTLTDQLLDKTLADRASVAALARVTASGANTKMLDGYFDAKIAVTTSAKDIKRLIDNNSALASAGLTCAKESLKRNQSHIDSVVMASPASFEEFFIATGGKDLSSLTPYAEFLDTESLKGKRNGFLSQLSPAAWVKFYPLFFATPINEKALVLRTLTDGLPAKERDEVLYKALQPARLAEIAAGLILENEGYSDSLLPILLKLQSQGITIQGKSYFDLFEKHRNDSKFAELLKAEYTKSMPLSPVEKEVERIELMAKYPILAPAISDAKLSSALRSVKATARTDRRKAADLSRRIIALSLKSKHNDDFRLLFDVIGGTYNADAEKLAKLGIEIGDLNAVKHALPELAKRRTQADLVGEITEFASANGMPRTELVSFIADAPDSMLPIWLEHIYRKEKKNRGAIIVAELEGAGLDHKSAVATLEKSLPEDHKAYLKSLQPNIFVRFGRWVKSLFGKSAASASDDKNADDNGTGTSHGKQDNNGKKAKKPYERKPSNGANASQKPAETKKTKASAPVHRKPAETPKPTQQKSADSQKPATGNNRGAESEQPIHPATNTQLPAEEAKKEAVNAPKTDSGTATANPTAATSETPAEPEIKNHDQVPPPARPDEDIESNGDISLS